MHVQFIFSRAQYEFEGVEKNTGNVLDHLTNYVTNFSKLTNFRCSADEDNKLCAQFPEVHGGRMDGYQLPAPSRVPPTRAIRYCGRYSDASSTRAQCSLATEYHRVSQVGHVGTNMPK